MEFRISDTFTTALGRLTRDEQKAVKSSVYDLQTNTSGLGLQLHRIDASKDPNFWSARVNRDIRIIVHKTEGSFLLAYVDHHDDAYKWAERRRIEAHPKTGALQIVEVRERVEEIAARPKQAELAFGDGVAMLPLGPRQAVNKPKPFAGLSAEQLLSVGIPEDWTADVLTSTEDRFLDLAEHLPSEAADALLEFLTTHVLPVPAVFQVADPFAHPDAQRRFRVIENLEELEQALNYPWEKWIVFLHPSQRDFVQRDFKGPARVMGSAGTGKTVVALHRAVRLARSDDNARVLLTTFSDPLASAIERKLKILAGDHAAIVPQITTASFFGIARELYQLIHARQPSIAKDDLIASLVKKASAELDGPSVTQRFLISEWRNVVDAWQLRSAQEYAEVPRYGRKSRLGANQRDRFWPVFERVRAELARRGLTTEAGVYGAVAEHYNDSGNLKPFTGIVVDEAQDLGVPELRMLAALAPDAPNALFFAGDIGQRIFQLPFSWKALGISVQGRSSTLKVNYRTSHQIREVADRLMPTNVADVDGEADQRKGTISIFNGPAPIVLVADDTSSETAAVAEFLKGVLDEGVQPEEIGIFVRAQEGMERARQAVATANAPHYELTFHKEGPDGAIRVGVMHLAKGLEFKVVVLMACDEDQLPLRSRLESVADEVELDDVVATERHLFYVACTRARDKLLVTGLKPGSDYLADLKSG